MIFHSIRRCCCIVYRLSFLWMRGWWWWWWWCDTIYRLRCSHYFSSTSTMATTATATPPAIAAIAAKLDHHPRDNNMDDDLDDGMDHMSTQLRQEALDVLTTEPELAFLLHQTILAPGVGASFDDAVIATVCFRLFHNNNSNCQKTEDDKPSNDNNAGGMTLTSLQTLFRNAVQGDDATDATAAAAASGAILEMGWTMSQAMRADCRAFVTRDPAMNTLLEVVLFSKGYAALVCHRVAFRLWYKGKRFTALYLQSQCSAVFGVDLHPCARIGASVMLDHGTGIVVGETACIGNGSTLLHNVTLGGTGKEHGDRHPKVGEHVLIGCNSSILGNVSVLF